MDTKNLLRQSRPYILAVVLFLIISLVYFSPVLEGKKLQSSDGTQFKGMAKEIVDYREATGKEALWANNMFAGMPAYLTSTVYSGEIFSKIQKSVTAISQPVMILTFSFVFFFILCILLDIGVWTAFAASLAYGMMTFSFVVMVTGHLTKAHALTYTSLVVAGVLLAFKKNKIGGSLIAALGLTWMLSANHLQMTYYAAILVLILGITYLVYAIREKTLPDFAKTTIFLLVAVLFAVGTNFSRLYTTYEYGKFSIRGQSELSLNDENKSSGLDKNYILDYSYDLGEAMTAFIPRFKGGGMSEPLGTSSETYKFLKEAQGADTAKKYVESGMPMYWGSQPISGAPFYFGAVLCFLFVLGLFLVKGKDKWWLVAVFVVSLLLSLGKNFSILTNLMLDFFPGYNKFRDVKNIIVIQQFAMALLGVLAIKEVYQRKISSAEFLNGLKYAFGITGGLALIFAVLPGIAGSFSGNTDAQYLQMGWPQQLIDALIADRKSALRIDAFRTFVFVALAAAGLWAYWNNKIKAQYAIILWVALVLGDMWPVNKRYFNNDNFTSKKEVAVPFQEMPVDKEIKKDKDLYYRVLNLQNPMADARTSYFHKSLGGYHGAKMKRYNELFSYAIDPEMKLLIGGFQKPESIDSVMSLLPVINMLNTKYYIYDLKQAPLSNTHALGNAWFVKEVKLVDKADDEVSSLRNFDPKLTAVVNKSFEQKMEGFKAGSGDGEIKLTEYQPNYLKYEATVNSGAQLAVFSEIYYPKGWKSFIDGKEVNHIQANYVLRAMVIPEGKHEIEFKFEPASYFVGNKVSLASSVLLLLAIAGYLFYSFKIKK
ncbi:MAG: YfhO family protein [Prolixibacteraceae bacterium]|nr:YfhO family protein [Prolixibacteraceae bacterium]